MKKRKRVPFYETLCTIKPFDWLTDYTVNIYILYIKSIRKIYAKTCTA